MIYAVIDTNILVSALITHNSDAATVHIVENVYIQRLTPLYNQDILNEYKEVLSRSKFKLPEEKIESLIEMIKQNGIDSSCAPFNGDMPDEDDRVFYEVTLSREDSFLVTGNLKHFPKTPRVVTAAQMLDILDKEQL